MDKFQEIELNAKLQTLIEQRNGALNFIVNLQAEIAVLKAKLAEKQLEESSEDISEP